MALGGDSDPEGRGDDPSHTASARARILPAMFLVGFFSITAQVTCVREMLVAFFGNELTVGVILATWLLAISLGAFSARLVAGRVRRSDSLRLILGVLGVALAVLLPLQVQWIRVARGALGVAVGEYAPLGVIFACTAIAFFPCCYAMGLFFPLACRLLAATDAGAGEVELLAVPVSRVYVVEAVGSMVGGLALSYVLLPLLSPLRLAVLGAAAGFLIPALVLPRRGSRSVWACVAVAAVAASLWPATLKPLEEMSVRARWRAFGVLPPEDMAGEGADAPAVRLVDHRDTVYQNLALTESFGQYALYANGEIMSVFPDPIGYEHSVHFVMAQNPAAERVLVIGGTPVGELPELLKYPLRRLVHVALDPGVGQLVEGVLPELYADSMSDPRVHAVAQDAVRYVKTGSETFDVVMVCAPSPSTAGANRYYTREFLESIRRILRPGGFVTMSITSSVRLQREAAQLGASVYQTLKSVYPVVLVTAGQENVFFASMADAGRVGGAGLTLDQNTLLARSRRAGVPAQFFRPEYFLGADEIDPEKVRFVESRFASAKVPLNTNLRPMTYFHHLVLWSRFSDSGVSGLLHWLHGMNVRALSAWLLGIGSAALLVAMAFAVARRRRLPVSGASRLWARILVGTLIGTTGFCGMALEMLLVYAFQGLYGYIYTRIGLIVAMFMLGLVVGACSGRCMARATGLRPWLFMAAVETLLVLFPFVVIGLMHVASRTGVGGALLGSAEVAIYLCVAVAGWAVGAEFPLGNRLFLEAGGSVGAAAAATDASDHCGAAVGSLAVGVFLVPVLGLRAACLVLVALKCCGLLLVLAARVSLGAGRDVC